MLITGLIGAGLLYTAVVSSESRVLFTVLGLFMLAVSVMMLLGQRRERRPGAASISPDGLPGRCRSGAVPWPLPRPWSSPSWESDWRWWW